MDGGLCNLSTSQIIADLTRHVNDPLAHRSKSYVYGHYQTFSQHCVAWHANEQLSAGVMSLIKRGEPGPWIVKAVGVTSMSFAYQRWTDAQRGDHDQVMGPKAFAGGAFLGAYNWAESDMQVH